MLSTDRSSFNFDEAMKRLESDGTAEITDEMVYPPTLIYRPSGKLMRFMIERAIDSKRDPATGKYKINF